MALVTLVVDWRSAVLAWGHQVPGTDKPTNKLTNKFTNLLTEKSGSPRPPLRPELRLQPSDRQTVFKL